MSKAGVNYDNAPIEGYFNTLKNDCVNLYERNLLESIGQAVEKIRSGFGR